MALSSNKLFILVAATSWINTIRQHPSDNLCPGSDRRLASRWHQPISVQTIETPETVAESSFEGKAQQERFELGLQKDLGAIGRRRRRKRRRRCTSRTAHKSSNSLLILPLRQLPFSMGNNLRTAIDILTTKHSDRGINFWSWKLILATFDQRCRGYKRPRPMWIGLRFLVDVPLPSMWLTTDDESRCQHRYGTHRN